MDIMSAIADIERKARMIMDAANEKKQDSDKIIAAKMREMEEKMQQRLASEYEEMKRKNDIECREKITELEKIYSERTEKLRQKCIDGKSEWTDKIFDAVISAK